MESKIKKILLVQLGSVGEVILTTPLIGILQEYYPQSQIACLTTEAGGEVINNHPQLDQSLVLEKQRFKRLQEQSGRIAALKSVRPLIKQVKDEEFDLVIDFNSTFVSALITWLTRAQERIGFKTGLQSLLYTKTVIPDRQIHIVEQYLQLLEDLEIDLAAQELEFTVAASQQDQDYIKRICNKYNLNKESYLVMFNLDTREETNWSVEKFIELGQWLQEHTSSKIVIVGSKDNKRQAEKINNQVRGQVLNLTGDMTPGRLSELVSRVDLVVSAVSEVLYLAQIFAVATIALFGSLDDHVYGPYGGNNIVINSSTDQVKDISVESVINYVQLLKEE